MKAFGNVHPFVLLVYFLSVLTVAMFAANPVLSLTALLGGILFCAMLVRRSRVPGDIGFMCRFFLLVAVTNPLFSHNGVTPLFFSERQPGHAGGAPCTGSLSAVAVVGVLLWCKGYSEVMTGDKFLYLFGSVIPRTGSCTVHGTPVRTAVRAADEACPVCAKDDGAVRGARLYG